MGGLGFGLALGAGVLPAQFEEPEGEREGAEVLEGIVADLADIGEGLEPFAIFLAVTCNAQG